MNTRTLKTEFDKNGYRYRQVLKTDRVVIYKAQDLNGSFCFYEVFEPKIDNLRDNAIHNAIRAQGFDSYEIYPGNENFGDWAWCSSDKPSLVRVLAKHFPGVSVDLDRLP